MNKITRLSPDYCPKTVAKILSLPKPANGGALVFRGQAYEIEHCDGEFMVWQIGYGQPFVNTWTDADFTFNDATENATSPTKETFESGQSFSDGNLVVGLDDRKIVISWNNTEHCKNMVTILDHQAAVNLYAVLTSVLRKQKLLFP